MGDDEAVRKGHERVVCGERLGPGHATHPDDDIDPRLAALRGFRVDDEAENG